MHGLVCRFDLTGTRAGERKPRAAGEVKTMRIGANMRTSFMSDRKPMAKEQEMKATLLSRLCGESTAVYEDGREQQPAGKKQSAPAPRSDTMMSEFQVDVSSRVEGEDEASQ
eukprot:767887-Hanusia_phi.AAC.2